MPQQLFDYDAAATLTGYSPETIKRYCDLKMLQRDRDFVIFVYYWRYGRLRRRIRLLTATGIEFLNSRRYCRANADQSGATAS